MHGEAKERREGTQWLDFYTLFILVFPLSGSGLAIHQNALAEELSRTANTQIVVNECIS